MSASKYKLDNLCVIVDNNNLQIDGTIEEVMSLYQIDEKFKSFGFEVINIDGNNMKQEFESRYNVLLQEMKKRNAPHPQYEQLDTIKHMYQSHVKEGKFK